MMFRPSHMSLAIAALLSLLLTATPAMAVNKVSSPRVTKDLLEVEGRSAFDQDDDPSRDNAQDYDFLTNYGVTDRVRLQGRVSFENPSDDNFDWTGLSGAVRWQFYEPDEAWLSSALNLSYSYNEASEAPDKIHLRLLLAREYPQFHHIANFGVQQEIGDGRDAQPTLTSAWKSSYKYNPYFRPGFEYHGRQPIDAAGGNDQYQLGPSATGKLVREDIRYNLAYLFGLNSATVDGELKLILTYGYQF
jgi:hypothetical protein